MPTDHQQREWMAQWHSAAIELARVRLAELASADLARVASDLEDARLRTCSAEDLIVHKAFAARPQDWVDIGPFPHAR